MEIKRNVQSSVAGLYVYAFLLFLPSYTDKNTFSAKKTRAKRLIISPMQSCISSHETWTLVVIEFCIITEEKDPDENVGQALLGHDSTEPEIQGPPPPYMDDDDDHNDEEQKGKKSPKSQKNGSAAKEEDDIKVDMEGSDDSDAHV